jgi:hypothetical protein
MVGMVGFLRFLSQVYRERREINAKVTKEEKRKGMILTLDILRFSR